MVDTSIVEPATNTQTQEHVHTKEELVTRVVARDIHRNNIRSISVAEQRYVSMLCRAITW